MPRGAESGSKPGRCGELGIALERASGWAAINRGNRRVALLHDVREFVGHRVVSDVGRQHDVTSPGERGGVQGCSGCMGPAIVVDPDVAQVGGVRAGLQRDLRGA